MSLAERTVERKFISNPTLNEMPKTADVVIIGGGMAGPAAAWALDRFNPGIKTVLLEQEGQLAAGASTASIENFRTCWPAQCLADMMMRSAQVVLNADEFLGEGASRALNVQKRGYLYCAFSEKQAHEMEEDVINLQEKIGLKHVEFLDASEVQYRYPWLGPRVVAAKVDPIAGWLDSNSLANLYAKSTTDSKFLLGMQNSKVIVEGNRVVGVWTPKGTIATENVIIASGANSRAVGRTAGIEIPIVLRPRQSFTTSWRHEQFPEDAPFIIGATPYPYVRPEAKVGAIFGWEYNLQKGEWDSRKDGRMYINEDYLTDPIWPITKVQDKRHVSHTLGLLGRQFGHREGEGFNDSRYLKEVHPRAGYYVYRAPEITWEQKNHGTIEHNDKSERAIIDKWPNIDGLFLSVAHVGHGVMSSPAAGEIVACHVLGQNLPNPLFANFGLDVHFVKGDGGGL